MALTTTNGMSIDDLSAAPNGPGLAQQLGNQVDAFYGSSAANAAALPATGKFAGQRVWLVDVKSHAIWDGSAWKYDTAWTVASLTAPWVSFDGGTTFDVPQYRRLGGVVYVKGYAKSGAAGATIFTLPAGLRPTKSRQFTSGSDGGARSNLIQVTNAGVVTIAAFGTGGSNAGAPLEFSFPAEQ